jgi:sialate O-acetylesterase
MFTITNPIRNLLAVASSIAFCATSAQADFRLPKLFSDNLVLQQQMKTPVWGWADDGEEVTVTFRGQKVSTTAKDGKWILYLRPLKAGGPDTLTVSGRNSITVNNVLVGEVWICSGQSNMEFPLEQSFESKADIENAANPMIRLFKVARLKADSPTKDVKGLWQECNSQTVGAFTAVGYYFGRALQKARNVPVGLIESNWGGSPAEVWMSQTALSSDDHYQREILDEYPTNRKKYETELADYKALSPEERKAGKRTAPREPWKPTELYNGMIYPLIPYGIQGVIWYQGESNAGRAEQYRSLFPDLIRNWRHDWNQGDFTFLAVQLAPYKPIKDQPAESDWAELREAQLKTTRILPNTGMAVITDVGDPGNIHPTKKQPVGERLALAARAIAYHEPITFSGPLYRKMEINGDKVTLSFDHIGKGLEARDGALKGFAICGDDRRFVWADAEIKGETIVVSSPSISKPVAVRYGWADCPVVNLWNKDGLPASPFRTDDFPMITASKKQP